MYLYNKFAFLKEYLETNNYDFDTYKPVSEVFDNVFEYFNNRAKWNLLMKSKDKIQKLNLELGDGKFHKENIVNLSTDSHKFEVI